jgi:hypothetical protein
MTPKQKKWILAVVVIWSLAAISIIVIARWPRGPVISPVVLTGAVLRQDDDPQKQLPLANTEVTATGGFSVVHGSSDSSGLFSLTLLRGLLPGQTITLRFEHPAYAPVQMTAVPQDQLYIVRMTPLSQPPPQPKPERTPTPVVKGSAEIAIRQDLRIRYSLKEQITANVGSVAKAFDVKNVGNVPCAGHPPCSPDGKWKATTDSLSIDAEKGNEFRNVRVSCIAGPCPFTKTDAGDPATATRTITVSVLNWSDTASFLLEAEVKRVMLTDTVRWSYPFIISQAMTFVLPAAAEGPSIEADLNGERVVFPLGPDLLLSWAACSVEVAPDHDKIYRCELKPGYQFRQ